VSANGSSFSAAGFAAGQSSHVNSTIDAQAKAYTVGHNTIDAGNATFRATYDPAGESASSILSAGSLGLFGVGVTGSTATADSHPTTAAYIGQSSAVHVNGGTLELRATSNNTAYANSRGSGAGLLAGIGAVHSVSNAHGTTSAYIDSANTVAGRTTVTGGSITMVAESHDTSSALSVASGGGLYGSTKNDANATVASGTTSYIGDGASVDLTANIDMSSSDDPEADAYTKGTAVGGLSIGGSESYVYVQPTVGTYIGSSANIHAGGTISLAATALPSTASAPDYHITALNSGDDTVTVTHHGLQTGDTVEYDNASGGSGVIGGLTGASNQNIGGDTVLVRRQYDVLSIYRNGTGGISYGNPRDGTYAFQENELGFGSTFNGATQVNTGTDTITFDGRHSFVTGDQVRYAPAGAATSVGGLTLNGLYYVIVVNDQTIRLVAGEDPNAVGFTRTFTAGNISGGSTITVSGNPLTPGQAVTYHAPQPKTFSSNQVDTTQTFTSIDGVTYVQHFNDSGSADNIYFIDENGVPLAHGFSNGDSLRYSVTSGDAFSAVAVAPLVNGRSYRVVNATTFSIQLKRNTAVTKSVDFVRSGSGDQIIRTDSTSWSSDGFGFDSGEQLVVTGSGANNGTYTIASASGSTLTLTAANTVQATRVVAVSLTFTPSTTGTGAHNDQITRNDGRAWTSDLFGGSITVTGSGSFSGGYSVSSYSGTTATLSSNGHFGGADSGATTVTGKTAEAGAITKTFDEPVLALNPTKVAPPPAAKPVGHNASLDIHSLIKTADLPINISGGGALVDGQTYFVKTVSGSDITVSSTSGGTALVFDTTGLGGAGALAHAFTPVANMTSPATDIDSNTTSDTLQTLRLDLTGSLPGGLQQILGPGGVPLSVMIPPAGDGTSSATSTGSGGGAIGIGSNTANVTVTQGVSAHIGSSSLVVAGGNVSITSSGTTNTATSSKNATGGIVGVGHADSNITQTNTSNAYIDGGTRVVTGGGFTMASSNSSNGYGSTRARGGGGIGVANAEDTQVYVAYTTTSKLMDGAEVFATGAVAITASSAANITADSDASGLGFGADGHSAARAKVGDGAGDATTQVELHTGSRVTGNSVKLAANVSQMVVHAHSESKGAGFYSEGIDRAEVEVGADNKIDLDRGATVYGLEGVDFIAKYAGVDTNSDSYARSTGLFGYVDADATNNTDLRTTVTGQAYTSAADHGLVIAGPRATGDPNLTPDDGTYTRLAFRIDAPKATGSIYSNGHVSRRSLAAGSGGESGHNLAATATVDFNSDVIINSGRTPTLVVASDGSVAVRVEIPTLSIGGGVINVGNIVNPGPGQSLIVSDSITGSGGTWEFRDTLNQVLITNLSNLHLQLAGIDVVYRGSTLPLVRLEAPTHPISFLINRAVVPSLVNIKNTGTGDVRLGGLIENPIGTTSIVNTGGGAYSTAARPTSLIRTNILRIDVATGVGTLASRVNVDVVDANGRPTATTFRALDVSPLTNELFLGRHQFFENEQVLYHSTGTALGGLTQDHYYYVVGLASGIGIKLAATPNGTPIVLDPSVGATASHSITPVQRFTVIAQQDIDLDVQGRERGTPPFTVFTPPLTDYRVVIDAVTTPGTIDIFLRRGGQDSTSGTSGGINVTYPSSADPNPYYRRFSSDFGPTPGRDPGVYGSGDVPVDVTYDFRALDGTGARILPGLVAGGNIILTGDLPSSSLIHVYGITEIVGTGFTETAGDGHHIDVVTNGDITIIEKTDDLRAGSITSTGRDVNLFSPTAIVDALNDAGADVTGRNITMTAGNNGLPGGIGGRGGVGTPRNFLETNVANGAYGVLNVTDTQSSRATFSYGAATLANAAPSGTYGVFVTETTGDLNVDRVLTNGDASLVTLAGSIIDGRSAGAGDNTSLSPANVVANNVWLDANGGSIGSGSTLTPDATGNDLKIDSGNLTPSVVGVEADQSIYLTEILGALNLRLGQALVGDIRLTVREAAGQGEDLNLLQPTGPILVVENATRTIAHGLINAPSGWVLLRAGDNITLGNTAPIATSVADATGNTQVLAGKWIDIFGDYGDLDPGYGTIQTLHGTITPGTLTTGCADNIDTVSTARACTYTRIFGNGDADTFDFEQTLLGGRTRVYGSNTPTLFVAPPAYAATAPLCGSGRTCDDFFYVKQLQTMNVAAGHTLTLDGQEANDTYVIYTSGSRGNARDYVINVLDTGAPDDGVDYLTICGADTNTGTAIPSGSDCDAAIRLAPPANPATDGDDLFLLRRTSYIGAPDQTQNERADRSAFVALLHTTLAVAAPSGTTTLSATAFQVERVNYDTAINGRLKVYGLGGNDFFAVDDNSAITTLDGGADNDQFQIGQIYGTKRDALPSTADGTAYPLGNTSGGSLTAQDVFGTVATTRGWLSAGASQPLVAKGGSGDDTFTVYSNQATLRLEGEDDNDLFVVRAFALAEIYDTRTNTLGVCATDVSSPFCQIKWISAEDQIAMPRLTSGFSTAAESDIRTGAGNNQVMYNVNAPVSIDGGNGFDKVVILGTEYADHIVITSKAIYGAGLSVTYANVEVLEVDALEGDDTIDVLSTQPGVLTRVIGGLGNDTINVAGDVAGDVVSRNLEGTTGTINHIVKSTDAMYNGLLADGIDLSVARPSQGQVVVTETAGFSAVRESGCFSLILTTCLRALDSYDIRLATAPTQNVYITVSGTMTPQEEQTNGDTFLVATGGTPGTTGAFSRTITVNGSGVVVPTRALVLVFTPGNWSTPQNVYLYAVDDTRPEGDRVVISAQSVISRDATFDHAAVRNVEVTVQDNDLAGIVTTQRDAADQPDNTSIVLEGAPTACGGASCGVSDKVDVTLAKAPTPDTTGGSTTTVVRVAPSDNRICVTSSDPRFSAADTSCPVAGTTYNLTFDATNWNTPVRLILSARNDFVAQDPRSTTLDFTILASASGATDYLRPPFASYPGLPVRSKVDVTSIDDETPGVFLLESGGATLVQCGSTCGTTGTGDAYTVRLTKAPTQPVDISIVTDGQTDVCLTGAPCATGIALTPIGGTRATQLFTGNLVTSGATLTRGTGADLGSFLDDGFVIGQQIQVHIGTTTVTRRVTDISLDGKTLTLDSAPGTGNAAGDIALLSDRGIYSGSLSYSATDATDPALPGTHLGGALIRTDNKSWLDSGFIEGQLIQIAGLAGTYKIEFITDSTPGSGKLDLARLTTVLPGSGTIAAGSTANVTQVARTVTFTTSNWYTQQTVPLLADPLFDLQPGRGDLKTFPKKEHLLSGIRGPLAVEGGVTTADRSIKHPVLLPGEGNAEPFQVAAQPPEWQMIDTLNVYADGSHENLVGQMTSTAITGLNMTKDLDLRAYCGIRPCPFNEPGFYPGGISYGTISIDATTGLFQTDGNASTIEVLNLFLGQGNDTFTVISTLVPALELANNGVARAAAHGGLTTVHGGGNTALQVVGTFDTTATSITRTDGVDWTTQGFKSGQTIQIGANTFTITGFTGSTGTPNSTMNVVAAVGSLSTTSAAALTIAVRDDLAVSTTFAISGNRIARTDGQPWQSLGFVRGQHVTIDGVGPRTIVDFDNSSYGDGTVLIVDGPTLPTATRSGTVAEFDRMPSTTIRMGGDTLIVTGGASTTAAGGPTSPLVLYGDTSQDGTWYAGRTDVLSLGIFGNKPFAHEEAVPATFGSLNAGLTGVITRTDVGGSWVASGFAVGAQLSVDGVAVGTVSKTSQSLVPTSGANVMQITFVTPAFAALLAGAHSFRVTNRTGNGAPFFVFPLATAYANAGNDVIDASLAFSASTPGALPTVGITAYGGAGDDTIWGTQTGDHLAGGSGNDRIYGGRGTDLIYGDSGFNVNVITRELFVVNNNSSAKPNADLLVAGSDLLYGDAPGVSAPLATQDDYADVIFGDQGEVLQQVLGARDTTRAQSGLQRIQTTAIPTLRNIESRNLQNGADDTIYGNAGRDILVGGTGNDAIDGGAQDDLVFGDNVVLTYRANDVTSLRFQSLTGTLLYSRTDINTNAALGYDNSGQLLTDGVTAHDYRSPDASVPWWAEYQVTNLYQTFSMDSGLSGVGSFGNDYIAGGAHNDLLFGQLGNDVVQGDGSIDYISHPYLPDLATTNPAALGGRVGASRALGTCTGYICQGTGPLTVYPTYEAATDGEDYIEGNGGNDVLFGGLGQDDLIGGSSDFFSLTTPDQRPDGSDLIFGGAGTRIGRDNDPLATDALVGGTLHSRDADTIVGDNGRIVRIVGTNRGDVGPAVKYVTFVYDSYGGTRLVVRGVTLIDYTVGGPDFRPDLFPGLPTNGTCSGSGAKTTGACSAVLTVQPGRNSWTVDIGGNDEIHAESGDDTVYAGVGHDVIFGDAGDDDLIGGWGFDWISGGTGQDGVIGDDGRIFTSRNNTTVGEPLYGIAPLLAADPDASFSNGNVMDEFIYTPGQVQTATINVGGALNKAVDLTPFNQTPNALGADQPLYDANNSDDVIFGGWDNDFLHGGSGDDALSGAEALSTSYIQRYGTGPQCQLQVNCAIGLVQTDFFHPFNPGDVLHFGADTNPWHASGHIAARLGEFLLYDEYDPRRTILFNADGSVWKGGAATTGAQYFLNFDATDGRTTAAGCVQPTNQGCALMATVQTDGGDVIFGDLGNDWMVGGTGNDTIYGGWGNDLSNADDVLSTNGWLNDTTDTHPTYEDRVYGGAGLDILIGNTGGDRLIDWVGEFNSYLVPFAPFGIATVSRQVEPQLPEFLYALSRAQGADPTRTVETGNAAARNGEPDGELGLITQKDHGLWQTQTGGPTDPQAGNIPGGTRDVLRSADFNNGALQGFAVDSGTFAVTNGALSVTSTSSGDSAAVFYADAYLPTYYEVAADVTVTKPVAGYKANSYVIFDYWSPTDFKFAGIDVSTNKLVVGHRTTAGWITDNFTPFLARADTTYNLLIQVNGTNVIVNAGTKAFSYLYGARVVDGENQGLNKGLLGFGSDQSRGTLDNIKIQVVPPQTTFDTTEDFNDGAANLMTGMTTGTWAVTPADGRYTGTPGAGTTPATVGIDLGARLQSDSYVEFTTQVKTAQMAGLVFDQYSASDYKFVAIDVVGQRIVVGHVDPTRGLVIEQATAKILAATTDYTLLVSLKATSAAVTLNGAYVTTWAFNAPVVDGSLGLFAKGGPASFDNVRIRSNDPVFAAPGNVFRGATSTGQPIATELMLPPLLAQAKSYWSTQLAISVASMSDIRITIADLPGDAMALTAGRTIYIDRDGAGGGWTSATLLDMIKRALGHILGAN